MGTNIYVEGFPAPVVITVRLHIETPTFGDIADLTSALALIDSTQVRFWPSLWPAFRARYRRYSYVVRFTKASPPEFTILSDPAWLAVFIAFLVGYKSMKENLQEIKADAVRVIRSIRGLTERQAELLEIAVRMSLDKILQRSEHAATTFLKQARRIRQAVVGDTEQLPDIEVIDVDRSIPR